VGRDRNVVCLFVLVAFVKIPFSRAQRELAIVSDPEKAPDPSVRRLQLCEDY